MAMTADSTSNHHSPRGSGFSGDAVSSPQQLRRKNNLSSPWSQVIRGESEPVLAAVNNSQSSSSSPPPPSTTTASSLPEPTDGVAVSPSKPASVSSSSSPPDNSMGAESSDANSGGNAARPKKPAWNKPSNGIVEAGPVMGAVSWPALSESTKALPKSSLTDSASSSPKIVSDGSVSGTQVPVIPHLPQKISSANANPNSNPNRTVATRQRSSKRGGSVSNSGGGPAETSFTRPSQTPTLPPPPPFPVFPMPPNSFGNLVPPLPDPSPREPLYRGSNWEARPVGGFVSDHRNSSRRGNYGPRGDGNYHNSFGGRRDQERGNYSSARDVHLQPQRGPSRGFVRPPPPNATTFMLPQPMRPFVNPMGFPEFIYVPQMPMEALRGVTGMQPFIPPAPVLVPVPEPSLAAMLVHQIEYYFSDTNLVKDEFLKSNMDDQGWVPITLIASFPRVKSLTSNVLLILDSLRTSTVVEVQHEKMRRRNEWMKWIPTASQVPTESGLSSPGGSSVGVLTTSFQNIAIEEGAVNQGTLASKANPNLEDASGRHSSESQLCNGKGTEDMFSDQN